MLVSYSGGAGSELGIERTLADAASFLVMDTNQNYGRIKLCVFVRG